MQRVRAKMAEFRELVPHLPPPPPSQATCPGVYGKNTGCGGTLEWVRFNVQHQASNVQVRQTTEPRRLSPYPTMSYSCTCLQHVIALQDQHQRWTEETRVIRLAAVATMQEAQGFWGCSNWRGECDYRESVPARHLSPQVAFEIISPRTFQASHTSMAFTALCTGRLAPSCASHCGLSV